jgi:hypothetical protein
MTRDSQLATHDPHPDPVARWVDARGVRWVVERDRLTDLHQVAAALADPTLSPVREIPSRAHFRISATGPGGRGVFVKLYRLLGWPRRLRHLIRPLPAAVEWAVARALAPHGLAAVVPWAWGQRRRYGIPMECYLIADDLGELPTLEHWVLGHRGLPGPAFRGALAALARALRRLHDLGYFHGDPHQRNIVPLAAASPSAVEGRRSPAPSGGLRWAFLDFQQSRRARLTAPYRRLRDLGRVFHGVRLHLGRPQRARLLRAYLAPRARAPRHLFRLLEAITLYYEFRLLRRRAHRALSPSGPFRRSRVGSRTLWHAPDADPVQIASRLDRPEGRPDEPLAVRGLRSRGRRAWLGAHALVARGLPTPRPLAWAAGGDRKGELLVTESPPGGVPLEAALMAARDPAEKARLLGAAGAALRRLHDLGGFQRAGESGLLAVRAPAGDGGGWSLLFARPEDVIFRPWVGHRARRRGVARLAAALAHAAPDLSEVAWRTFLHAYLAPGASAARAEALWLLLLPYACRSIATPAP